MEGSTPDGFMTSAAEAQGWLLQGAAMLCCWLLSAMTQQ
jgi:hypothetical protein